MTLPPPSEGVPTIARWPMRRLIAVMLAFDLVMLGAIVSRATPSDVSARNVPALLLWLGGRPGAVVPIVVLGLALVWSLWRGVAPARVGFALLLIGALLNESLASLFGMPMRFLFHGGVALIGWLAGLSWARFWWRQRDDVAVRWHEHVASIGTLGALAASYFGAVSSKLLARGLAWGDAGRMQAVVLGHHHFDAPRVTDRFAERVVASPKLALTLAVATLVIQAGAVFLLAGPRIRRVWAVLLIGFHANVMLLTHILFPQVMFILAMLLPASRDRVVPPGPARPASTRNVALVFAPVVMLAVAAWTLPPMVWRNEPRHDPPSNLQMDAPPLPVPATLTPLLSAIAPGQVLAGWRVESIHGSVDGGASIEMKRPPQTIELVVIGHGVRAFDPPAQIPGFDLYTEHAMPADRQPTATEAEALIAALRDVLIAHQPPPQNSIASP